MTSLHDYIFTEFAFRKVQLMPTDDVVIVQNKDGVVISVESREEIFKKIEDESN
jgi:hypothetical protein